MPDVTQIIKTLMQGASSFRFKSQAMAPALWYLLIMTSALLSSVGLGSPEKVIDLFCSLLGWGAAFTGALYAYLAVFDPNRIGSEVFVTQQHKLMTELAKHGTPKPSPPIADPEPLAIPEKTGADVLEVSPQEEAVPVEIKTKKKGGRPTNE